MSLDKPRRCRRLLSAVAAASVFLGFALAAPRPAVAEGDGSLPALQVVVLVDESGSLSDGDVIEEKKAARTIAFSVLGPGSLVSVVGFGSSNGPGQSAVDVVCPPTRLDNPQAPDTLAKCVDGLHRRGPQEGSDTDHAAALQQALSFVQSAEPKQKVVFLLTDGKLDVSNSPAYGDNATRRNAAATGQVARVLDKLDDVGAQVWPLGFGSVDRSSLENFARGRGCASVSKDPAATIIPDSAELTAAVSAAFSSATCVKYGNSSAADLAHGGEADLYLEIPAVASEASILVYKRDPRVQVEFLAPGASRPAPAAGGSAYEFAGQSTATESLRISDPVPGRWTVHLTSAEVAANDIRATVVYQSAVRAVLSVNPPQPAAGQTVTAEMQVWARNRAITYKPALKQLTFVMTMAGADVPPVKVVPTDPDGDGTFTVQIPVPATASGPLTFTGTVAGIGIGGDTRTLSTRVQGQNQAIQGQFLFDEDFATTVAGTDIPGRITVANRSGGPAKLRVVIADASSGAALTVDPAVIDVAAGVSSQQFTLRVGEQSQLGVTSATLRLVDDTDPSAVIAERLFAVDVVPVPTVWEKLRWLWIGLGVLLLIMLFVLSQRWRARTEARKVRGLTARLLTGGFVTDELDPRDPDAKVFRFVLIDDFTGLHLQPASAGEDGVHEVRRTRAGLELVTPAGRQVVAPGEHHPIRKNLAIAITDDRIVDGTAPDTTGDTAFDPFHTDAGLGDIAESDDRGVDHAGVAVPGPRSDSSHSPFEDPYGDSRSSPPTTAFGPTDPFGPSAAGEDPFGSGPARRSNGETYTDPYNPFS